MFQIFLTYRTSDDVSFFMFGDLNAKNLAFSTPDENAIIYCFFSSIFPFFCYALFPLREETQRRLKRKNSGLPSLACHHRSTRETTTRKADFFHFSLLVVVL